MKLRHFTCWEHNSYQKKEKKKEKYLQAGVDTVNIIPYFLDIFRVAFISIMIVPPCIHYCSSVI